ncbi:MAG: EamA family transporter [Herminiimonas sp.]|nr:EamA family transporter [Herminiimonas sp.]
MMIQGVTCALLAAALFGASTPLAKLLAGQLQPALLAGLLYAGSGIGLSVWLLLRAAIARRDRGLQEPERQVANLGRADIGWLAAAILAGGVAGPLLLMIGLRSMPASSAALLLNLEGVLTALLAWFAFHENFDRRILLGMAAIVGAGILLSLPAGFPLATGPTLTMTLAPGVLAIAGACLCWALDNNFTRKVAASDAVQIAAWKGMVAGTVNLSLAALLGASWPGWSTVLAAGLLGLCGYGLSLVLFVLALRQLGSARTGAYFSAAPFVGAAIAIGLLHEATDGRFWGAAALMAFGLWLHLSERHHHRHQHEPLLHTHEHVHNAADAHHWHDHDFAWDGQSPHTHRHQHEAIAHTHAHFPDIHHRHRH